MINHHALLSIGPHDACLAHVPAAHRSGVDADVIECELFEIADARLLAEKAATRPIEHEKRYFVVSCKQMTLEAQNALLKLFEDPPATAQFYLILPRAELLLPTLRSRLHLLHEEKGHTVDPQALSFLRATYAARLDQVARLAKSKDTSTMRLLIRDLEYAVAARIGKEGKKAADCLGDMLLASSYAETRGASHKMLLEHLALSVPEKVGV